MTNYLLLLNRYWILIAYSMILTQYIVTLVMVFLVLRKYSIPCQLNFRENSLLRINRTTHHVLVFMSSKTFWQMWSVPF